MNRNMVGIQTVHSEYNYGSKLQAYAMMEIVRHYGKSPEIMAFQELKFDLFSIKYCVRTFLINIFSKYKKYKEIQQIHRLQPCNKEMAALINIRREAIDSFDKMLIIKKIHGTKKQFGQWQKRYKAVICGSDQIWRPYKNPLLDLYLFEYTPGSTRKISYGPSLGVSIIPSEQIDYYNLHLASFYSLSCREIEGAKELHRITNRDVEVVLDPTMLVGLPIWDKLLDTSIDKGDYILSYLLGTNTEHREICHNLSKKLGVKILNFSHFKLINEGDENLESESLYDINPQQFLTLIKKARFVVTDSFHCTAFCIQFHTPFCTLLRFNDSKEISTNSRIYSLLSQLRLEDRICRSLSDIDSIISNIPDFEMVDNILDQLRIKSWKYLDKSFRGL